jgi:hypothetical protein
VILRAAGMKLLEFSVTNKIPTGLPGISVSLQRRIDISSFVGALTFGNFSLQIAPMSATLLIPDHFDVLVIS